jgi:hypothetical protein
MTADLTRFRPKTPWKNGFDQTVTRRSNCTLAFVCNKIFRRGVGGPHSSTPFPLLSTEIAVIARDRNGIPPRHAKTARSRGPGDRRDRKGGKRSGDRVIGPFGHRKDQKRKAKSQKPNAKSQKPRAKSQEPEAKSQRPKGKSQEPRATGQVLTAKG